MKSKDLKLLRKKVAKARRTDKDPLSSFDKEEMNLGSVNSNGGVQALSLKFVFSAKMSGDQLRSCLSLFEKNMGDLYRNSSWGLNMDEKTAEMKHENARFLLLTTAEDTLGGFVHFRFEYDDDERPTRAVLYLYEIQMDEMYQRQGLGKKLLSVVEKIATDADVSHVVLTSFKANKDAMRFYENRGYQIDETDPENFNEPVDYKILSRPLK